MKLSKALPVLVFILMQSAAVFAATDSVPAGITILPLAGITNDRDTTVSYLKLMVNSQATVRGIYLETEEQAKVDGHESRQVASKKIYWLKNIERHPGVVLGQGQGVKAIYLSGNIDSRGGRGSLTIRYLTNGIFMHYSQCKIGLQRVSRHNWELVNAYNGHRVKQIKVRTWMLGISTLANVCPNTLS